MKRFLAILLIGLLCLSLLIGCGKKEEPQTEQAPAEQTAPTTTDTAAAPTDTAAGGK